MGRTVLLMEPGGHLGRITVEGLGSSDIDKPWFRNSLAVGGLAKEFDPRIGAARGKSGPVYKFASSVAEKVLLAWLNEHGIPDQLNAILHPASKKRSRHRIPSQDRGRPRQLRPPLQVRIVGRREGVTRLS